MVKQNWMGKTCPSQQASMNLRAAIRYGNTAMTFLLIWQGTCQRQSPCSSAQSSLQSIPVSHSTNKSLWTTEIPQKIKKSTVSSTEQKHKERDKESERERESPVVCSVPWSITFIWADRAAVYWTKSWLKPPSPSNKPKSSSRISASLCVPSCCCGNVLLLLLSLYWSGCNCSKTLFGGASSFHGVGGILGFLKHLKPQATVFPRDIKAPDWFSAWYHLLEHNDFWKVSLSTCIQSEWTIEHKQSVLWNQLQGEPFLVKAVVPVPE